MIGPIRGMKLLVVPVAAFALQPDPPRQEARDERDAEEDQHRPRDLPDPDLEPLRVEAEPARQHRQVEVAEQRVGGDLEERVEDDEQRGAVAVASCEVVPDQHHRDAARQADDDHAGAVGGLVGEEQPGEREHEQRPDDPGQEERDTEELPVGDAVVLDAPQLLVAHLRQDRIHHQQQPQRDRQRDRADLELVEAVVQRRDQSPEAEPGRHRKTDPERQEPVERRQLLEHGGLAGHAAEGASQSQPSVLTSVASSMSCPRSSRSPASRSRLAQ